MVDSNVKLICGDCKDVLKTLKPDSIDLVVTSPPYDNLRDYNGQKPFCFDDFKQVANELKRTLKKGGVIVWVTGDACLNGSETGTSFRQALYFKEIGLRLHDTMIYKKTGFSFPSCNRYHQVFEYMFIISKGAPKTFNPIKDRHNRCYGEKIKGSQRDRDGHLRLKNSHGKGKRVLKFGSRTNIWKIQNGYQKSSLDKIAYQHPAIFPESLARDHILTWSNKGDVVLDPFLGSGTTGKVSKLLNRHFVGVELDSTYFDLARSRIHQS